MENFGMMRQFEIYGKGQPVPHVTAGQWESEARKVMEPGPFGYLHGNAGIQSTTQANRDAFSRWAVRPRMLHNVGLRDWSSTLFGTRMAVPLLLAPIGVQSIIHPEGEMATARAARDTGTPFVVSTVSSYSLEQIADILPAELRWFQVYPGRDWEVMVSMIARAKALQYSALVVTVDTPMLAWRPMDLNNAYLPFLQGQGMANYWSDPVFRSRLSASPEDDPGAATQLFLSTYVNPEFDWQDLKRLRLLTDLPLLIKGLTHPEDARMALAAQVDGIIVSNHGGRQVDGAVAALDMLPMIVEAVDSRVPVLFDSGIRCGADMAKALALGAGAVLLGRPYGYALAVAGEAGVRQNIEDFRADFDLQMALSGISSLSDWDRRNLLA